MATAEKGYTLVLEVESRQWDNNCGHNLMVTVGVAAMVEPYRNERYDNWRISIDSERRLLDLSMAASIHYGPPCTAQKLAEAEVYHRGLRYEATESNLSLETAEAAVKMLKPVMGKLERMRQTEGDAGSFGAIVNRFARALGIAHLIMPDQRGEYAWYGLAHIPAQIDYIFTNWRYNERVGLEKAAAGEVQAA